MYMKFPHQQFFTLQKWRSQFANNVTLMKRWINETERRWGGDLPVAMCLTLYYPTSAGPATITWKYLALLSSGSAWIPGTGSCSNLCVSYRTKILCSYIKKTRGYNSNILQIKMDWYTFLVGTWTVPLYGQIVSKYLVLLIRQHACTTDFLKRTFQLLSVNYK